MRKRNSSVDDVTERRLHLGKIMDEFAKNMVIPTKRMLFDELKKRYDVSYDTFYRDWTHELGDNTFLRDIGESTYSRMVEELFEDLDNIRNQLFKWLDNPPRMTKQVNVPSGKLSKNGDPLFKAEQVITETVSPLTITNLVLRSIELRAACLKGDIVDTAIALLQDSYKKIKQRNQELEIQCMTSDERRC